MRQENLLRFEQRFDAAIGGGDLAEAAQLLEDHCDALFSRGEARLFARCAAAIPPRMQAFHPRTMLALAWRLITQWHFGQVDDLLAATRLRLEEIERAGRETSDLPGLWHALGHREMMLALTQDDMQRAERLCAELITGRYQADSYVKGSLFTSLLHARSEQFKLADMDRLDTQAIDYLSEDSNRNALFVHDAVAGLALLALGRSGEAVPRLRAALGGAQAIDRTGGALAAIPALPLAEVLYEQAQYREARDLASQYLACAHEMGIVDQLISGYLTLARLHRREGKYREALELLDTAVLFAAKRGFRRLSAWAQAERFAILLHQGRLGSQRDPEKILRAGAERHMPGVSVTTLGEAEALTWARLAEAHCRVEEGLRLASAWSRRMRREGAVRSRVRWNLVEARFLLLGGEMRRAARLVDGTLPIAAKGSFFSSFLDEAPIMRLLAEMPGERADPQTAEFLHRLMAFCDRERSAVPDPGEGPAALGSLSPREIDVLTLASAAWRNSDIADRLGLTEGTVKWYLQQIYDKLGVRKRALAVDKARRFGIIASPG